MRISVVIPCLNSESVIGRALNAIFAGKRKPDEVIVVDGFSKDRTKEIARTYGVLVFSNPKVHAAAARNIGIDKATGEVIAFTDSDCVPQPDWLERIEGAFAGNPTLRGLGGRMLALPPQNDIEDFSGHVFLNEILCYPLTGMEVRNRMLVGAFVTANCAYRRDALFSIGGFRDEFGNNAEDIDLYWRLIKSGGCLFYDPEVIVYHSFPRTRRSLAKKYFQHGIASSKLTRYHLGSPQMDWFLYRKLLHSLCYTVIPNSDSKWARLYCIQLGSHIAGKVYGSYLMRVINF